MQTASCDVKQFPLLARDTMQQEAGQRRCSSKYYCWRGGLRVCCQRGHAPHSLDQITAV